MPRPTARIGKPVSALVSRHIGRSLGNKITGRTKLSPAAMEATHDLDFILWCLLAGETGARLFASSTTARCAPITGADVPDTQYITVTMDSGMSFVIGAGWSLPPGYPNFSIDLDRNDRHRRRADLSTTRTAT